MFSSLKSIISTRFLWFLDFRFCTHFRFDFDDNNMVLAILTQNLARQRKRILSLGFQAKYFTANTTSKRTSSTAFRSVGVSGLVQFLVFRVDLWTSSRINGSVPVLMDQLDSSNLFIAQPNRFRISSNNFSSLQKASHHLTSSVSTSSLPLRSYPLNKVH